MSSSSSSHAPEKQSNETVTISEVIKKQNQLEDQAAEVLPFDITKCTKPAGHIRQSVYSCLTCNPINPDGSHLQSGVCSSCSVSCHTDHHLVELFVRRNFACDCGTARCNPGGCVLLNYPPGQVDQSHPSTSSALSNRYDKNFDGHFCVCERGKTYDPETETEDMYQCLACEDWRHASCLGPHPHADDWDDLICADCVQNNPTIKSILFKHAGGEGTGMLVCKDSGTDEPDRITCYGKLPDSNADAKPERDPSLSVEVDPEDNGLVEVGSQIIKTEKQQPEVENVQNHSEASSHVATSCNSPLPIHRSDANPEPQEPQEKRTNESADPPKDDEDVTRENKLCSSAEPASVVPDKKRTCSADPEHTISPCAKKPKLEQASGIPKDDRREGACRAPFKNVSDSVLHSLDPRFSNVFLVAGWRTRWCRCPDCFEVLSRLSWLVEEEEDVWEPGEDADSLKSIHDLGLEALQKLPREQLVHGLSAYNKLKQQMLEFLRPFESQDLLVTEQDIRQFFSDTKAKIHNRTW
ncbi:hypothetical protein PCANC_15870 [Puccinia coronata f. sp. avenae]|uniref:UBR-type domain-containing protein n=1 Tax=Puccinia coronata f. sp. avenae TaxID=200324 RepID=A0A2N5SE70_9BASI|nr:hypothetical protein PCASD_25055 [Puccinia coronata f. sp. avenae]PLW11550.1 hypothetical protein PCANC_20579 [Puccinia coronata f. sp. avenae]PLW39700.1 hypothetical protein PCANC_15870 [Puccinia coronata f. sp. avenae]PLW46686.1 hypothetical protein PCASD_03646 [Puccinia coronata f. sp. avenae]